MLVSEVFQRVCEAPRLCFELAVLQRIGRDILPSNSTNRERELKLDHERRAVIFEGRVQ